jgi:hypothetical protein
MPGLSEVLLQRCPQEPGAAGDDDVHGGLIVAEKPA